MKIKVRDVRPIVIRGRETGDEIVRTWSVQQAREIIKQFEKEDKENKVYEPNFYEIYNTRTNEIAY